MLTAKATKREFVGSKYDEGEKPANKLEIDSTKSLSLYTKEPRQIIQNKGRPNKVSGGEGKRK